MRSRAHKKITVNQLVLSPLSNGGFFAFVIFTRMRPIAWMTGAKWAALKAKLAQDLFPTFMRGNVYWSCVQAFNFKVLPASAVVVSTNFFVLIWTAYICVVASK